MNVVRVDIDMHLISAQRGSGNNMAGPWEPNGGRFTRACCSKKCFHTLKNSETIESLLLDPDVKKKTVKIFKDNSHNDVQVMIAFK